MSFLFIGFFLLLSFTSSSQTPNNYKEKIYLHFDKPYYATGDIIWFKAYLIDAETNLPNALSKMLYVDLIDPSNKIIFSRILKIEKGGAAGDFQLSYNLQSGKYRVRSYTNYMRNFDDEYFFRKDIIIHNFKTINSDSIITNSKTAKKEKKYNENVNLRPDLQFFPESGSMVSGILNRIGFKAIGIDGKGVSVSGSILDDVGTKIVEFNTLKFGLGLLKFTPIQDRNYIAQINYNGVNYKYNLPEALDKGVVIQVYNRKDFFRINLQSSLPEGVEGLKVVGKQGSEIVCQAELSESRLSAIVNIPKEFLEEGIVQFTVFDKNMIPQCERLVFVETNDIGPKVTIISPKDSYKSRELIELNLLLSSQLEKQQANMSISVTDVSVVQKGKNDLDIKSHLLLNSELRGNIEQTNYYFESKDPERKQVLDLLMMTQGWRRYLWNNVQRDTLQKIKHEIEKGFTISGTVRKFYNSNKTVPAHITLMTMNKNTINNFEFNTDNQGKFTFGPYAISDTITVIIKAKKIDAKGEKEKKRSGKSTNNYSIVIDNKEVPVISKAINNAPIEFETSKSLEIQDSITKSPVIINKDIILRYYERSRNKQFHDSVLKVEKGRILIDEVTITGEKPKSIELKLEQIKQKKRYILAKNPSNTLSFQELVYIPSNPLKALQGRVPGVRVIKQSDGSLEVYTRGGGSPMQIFLDGMPLEDASFINSANIDFIDVIKPPRSYIFGDKGHSGIIAMYTKDAETDILLAKENSKNKKKPKFTKFVHPGYYHAKEFYSPNTKLGQADYRSTIFWNPNVRINEKGEGKISFYSSDTPTTYRVELEGLTGDGIPITEEIFIKIKE